jgi:hypothetical protein
MGRKAKGNPDARSKPGTSSPRSPSPAAASGDPGDILCAEPRSVPIRVVPSKMVSGGETVTFLVRVRPALQFGQSFFVAYSDTSLFSNYPSEISGASGAEWIPLTLTIKARVTPASVVFWVRNACNDEGSAEATGLLLVAMKP